MTSDADMLMIIHNDITDIKVSQAKTETTLVNIKEDMVDGKKRFEKIEKGCKGQAKDCDKRFDELEGFKNKFVGALLIVPPAFTAASLWIRERWPW